MDTVKTKYCILHTMEFLLLQSPRVDTLQTHFFDPGHIQVKTSVMFLILLISEPYSYLFIFTLNPACTLSKPNVRSVLHDYQHPDQTISSSTCIPRYAPPFFYNLRARLIQSMHTYLTYFPIPTCLDPTSIYTHSPRRFISLPLKFKKT